MAQYVRDDWSSIPHGLWGEGRAGTVPGFARSDRFVTCARRILRLCADACVYALRYTARITLSSTTLWPPPPLRASKTTTLVSTRLTVSDSLLTRHCAVHWRI
jgi:hypothetical protein